MYNTSKNSVQLVGRVGKDIELIAFENGNQKAHVILAINEYYKDKNGEVTKNTEWHKLVFWGKTALQLAQNVKKGDELSTTGKLVNRTYVDKDGNTKYITEVIVNEFHKISKMTEALVDATPF